MSIGNLGSCAPTLPEIMQENRLHQASSPLDNNLLSSEAIKNSNLGVEPSSIDSNNTEITSPKKISPTQSVTATEPISNSTIEATIASNKSTTNNYQVNGQQARSNLIPGLLIDIKV